MPRLAARCARLGTGDGVTLAKCSMLRVIGWPGRADGLQDAAGYSWLRIVAGYRRRPDSPMVSVTEHGPIAGIRLRIGAIGQDLSATCDYLKRADED